MKSGFSPFHWIPCCLSPPGWLATEAEGSLSQILLFRLLPPPPQLADTPSSRACRTNPPLKGTLFTTALPPPPSHSPPQDSPLPLPPPWGRRRVPVAKGRGLGGRPWGPRPHAPRRAQHPTRTRREILAAVRSFGRGGGGVPQQSLSHHRTSKCCSPGPHLRTDQVGPNSLDWGGGAPTPFVHFYKKR